MVSQPDNIEHTVYAVSAMMKTACGQAQLHGAGRRCDQCYRTMAKRDGVIGRLTMAALVSATLPWASSACGWVLEMAMGRVRGNGQMLEI